MIINFARPDPRYGGGGAPLVFAYPQRGLGGNLFREIPRFALRLAQRIVFRLQG